MMDKVGYIMHFNQEELSILYSALRRRAEDAMRVTKKLEGHGLLDSAKRAYTAHLNAVALAERVRKHLTPNYLD